MTSSPTIQVTDLTKTYASVHALAGVSFEVQKGEVVGFLGPNGAGKSTTMKILTGFMSATSGRAHVAGFDVATQPHEVQRRVGYLPERVGLYEEMLVADYLHFVCELRGVDKARRRARIQEVAQTTGLVPVMHKSTAEISRGYRQRVGLAQAIIHEPDVVILDEPTSGLDPNQIVEIRDVIKNIGATKTVLFSTHIMQEVEAVCDRVLVLNRGQLVAQGSVDALREQVADDLPGSIGLFKTRDAEALLERLRDLKGVDHVDVVDARATQLTVHLHTTTQAAVEKRMAQFAKQNKAHELLAQGAPALSLEAIFRHLTQGHTQEQETP